MPEPEIKIAPPKPPPPLVLTLTAQGDTLKQLLIALGEAMNEIQNGGRGDTWQRPHEKPTRKAQYDILPLVGAGVPQK